MTKQNRSVLVVEDDEQVLRALATSLRLYGHNVLTATNGVEALSILHADGEHVYVVVLDMVMPQMDGLAVIQHMLNVHGFPVGIVVLSGYTERNLDLATLRGLSNELVEARSFMQKPVDLDKLIEEIARAMESVEAKRGLVQSAFVGTLNERLSRIERATSRIDRKLPPFLAQLGLDLVRAIVLGLAVLATLRFGLADFLARVLRP